MMLDNKDMNLAIFTRTGMFGLKCLIRCERKSLGQPWREFPDHSVQFPKG